MILTAERSTWAWEHTATITWNLSSSPSSEKWKSRSLPINLWTKYYCIHVGIYSHRWNREFQLRQPKTDLRERLSITKGGKGGDSPMPFRNRLAENRILIFEAVVALAGVSAQSHLVQPLKHHQKIRPQLQLLPLLRPSHQKSQNQWFAWLSQ